MSETKLVSPLLDGFILGNPMSKHHGVRCCPAIKENTDEKYIVKIISVPESQVQLDALLLTGAYRDPADAMDYFKDVADGIAREAELLKQMAKLEGFLSYQDWQVVPMENGLGYEVYLLGTYKRSLERYMKRNTMTHLEAINLGLDLCAALSICRRAGSMYVDLKPSNIFLSREKEYRIGDLGFVDLDSLQYTSLPGKYRSPYSPPEAMDDLKTLNKTVDTYAVGMILYQIYNNNQIPQPPRNPADAYPFPANADYELAEIIMKALAPNPDDRWKTPMEMGQALVAYMQRNTVNNTPILPVSGVIQQPQPSQAAHVQEMRSAPQKQEAQEALSDSTEPVSPEASSAEPDVSVPAPEPAFPAYDDTFEIDWEDPAEENVTQEPEVLPEEEPEIPPVPQKRQKKERKHSGKGLLIAVILILVLALLGAGAYWFYQNYYLQTVDNLLVEGTQSQLTVTVETDIDDSLLTVSCTDTYGNGTTKEVVNGQAVFTDLLPGSLYRVELNIDGFHQLIGKTAEIFTTDSLPEVISMSAITGNEDGSVMLNFTVDGSDPEQWQVTCSAEGEEDIVEVFSGHSITVEGLAIGKLYTIQLDAADGTQVLGNNTMEFASTALILAEDLRIVSSEGGNMTVRWNVPQDVVVESWTVRCYNDDGYEEVLEDVATTEIVFTNVDISKAYTVEVTAAGMTQPNRASITANPLTVTNVSVDESKLGQLTVSWDYEGETPDNGWLLIYSYDDLDDNRSVVKCDSTSAVISPAIPGASYRFEIQAADSTSIFRNVHTYDCPYAAVFQGHGLSAEKVTAHLLKTPEQEGWTCESVGSDAFTDTFQTGDSISVVLKASSNFYLPEAEINIMYVIRDGEGNVLADYISRETGDWSALWYDDDYHNGELTIPKVPKEPGDYSVNIYFNDLAVTSTVFTITE